MLPPPNHPPLGEEQKTSLAAGGWSGGNKHRFYRVFLKFDHSICENDTSPFGKGGSRWGDENHQKTGFKLIPFLFLIIQAEQK